jgi:hypothetical protein
LTVSVPELESIVVRSRADISRGEPEVILMIDKPFTAEQVKARVLPLLRAA